MLISLLGPFRCMMVWEHVLSCFSKYNKNNQTISSLRVDKIDNHGSYNTLTGDMRQDIIFLAHSNEYIVQIDFTVVERERIPNIISKSRIR